MRAYDIDLEIQVLRSCVSSPKRLSMISATGGAKLFSAPSTQEIFDRARSITRQTGEAPTWKELTFDNQIPESIRSIMREAEPSIKDIKKFKNAARQLSEYARIRVGAEAAVSISELLENEAVDANDITDILTSAASNSRKIEKEEIFRHYGKSSSRKGSDALATLMNTGKKKFIPTGLKSFDARSRGFMKPSLVVLASESGGGKSKLAGTLSNNMARMGFRVVTWCLEMDHDEMEMRELSRISGIPMDRFLFPERLTPKMKKHIEKRFNIYQSKLKVVGGQSSYAVPTGDVSIQDVLEASEPYDYDCVIIDYISLLSNASEDQQWRALSDAARYAKRWANSTDTCVIVLAQLKGDEQLKMASYIKDHANNMWCFPAGTLVDTPTGLKPIETLVPDPSKTHKNVNIPIMSNGQEVSAINFVNSGVKPVMELQTKRGPSVIATPNEKFRVLTEEFAIRWRTLKTLKPNDWVIGSLLKNDTQEFHLDGVQEKTRKELQTSQLIALRKLGAKQKLIEEFIKNGYFLETVDTVLPKGKMEVFDVSVPDTHTFVANGFVVHNTWLFGEKEELTRIIKVRQQKARQQPVYNFILKDDTSTMTIRDCTEEEASEYLKSQERGSNRGGMSDYEKIKTRR